MLHDEGQNDTQQDHGHQVDRGQARADGEGHDHGHDHGGGGTDAQPQDHHVGHLQVGHIGGQTGDETGGAELVDVGEGEGLDVLIHGLAQVPGKTGRGIGAVLGTQQTGHQTQQGQDQHEDTHLGDVGHVAQFHALVDDGGHQQGDDHFHGHFEEHADGGEDGVPLEFLHMGQKCFQHGFTPFCR